MNQESTQLAAGGSTFTTGYATGATCLRTGSYKSSNKYMDTIIVVSKGDTFPAGSDGKKTTWTALSTADGSKESFNSVKVAAGTI